MTPLVAPTNQSHRASEPDRKGDTQREAPDTPGSGTYDPHYMITTLASMSSFKRTQLAINGTAYWGFVGFIQWAMLAPPPAQLVLHIYIYIHMCIDY